MLFCVDCNKLSNKIILNMYKETFEFLTNNQQNSSNFFKRLKDSNEPFYRKIVKVIFFFNFMMPSALLL